MSSWIKFNGILCFIAAAILVVIGIAMEVYANLFIAVFVVFQGISMYYLGNICADVEYLRDKPSEIEQIQPQVKVNLNNIIKIKEYAEKLNEIVLQQKEEIKELKQQLEKITKK